MCPFVVPQCELLIYQAAEHRKAFYSPPYRNGRDGEIAHVQDREKDDVVAKLSVTKLVQNLRRFAGRDGLSSL